MSNPYNEFVQAVVSNLMGNIGTLYANNNTLDVWTNTNATLTNNWTSGNDDSWLTGSNEESLHSWLNANVVSDGSTPTSGQITMETFIKTYLTSQYLYEESNGFMTSVMTFLGGLANNSSGSGSNATSDTPTQMSMLTTWNSLLTSKAQLEEQPGETAAKTQTGVVQQGASAQQTIADMATQTNEASATYASLLQQSF